MANTKTIYYLGPMAEVTIKGVGVVKRGDSIKVPAKIATSLLAAKDSWSETANKSFRKNIVEKAGGKK